ncbi:MrcB family domain-containing protein [Streptomyces sp. NPDC059272]|uniref:MrcB family domain-containing protein n=1 Tax=Streptomyces sp. NPDC059272 TaxID=3346800 RepID=UPI00368934F0
MTLREYLHNVASTYDSTYDRTAGTGSPAAKLLRSAPSVFEPYVPASYLIKGSAGNGAGAFRPWVSFFDPDETTTATRGMYLVYLFAEDMKTVSLSLNQGVTELRDTFGAREAETRLRSEAAALRGSLPSDTAESLNDVMNLGGRAGLPRAYEAGNILAVLYEVDSLPAEEALKSDLRQMIQLYQDALVLREELRSTTRDLITTIKPKETGTGDQDPLLYFAPKSDEEYVQKISARVIKKSRKHETLVKRYGSFLADAGFTAGTNVHPRDLVARRGDGDWLIEAKVVRRGNVSHAVREAIGQLATYAFLLYPKDSQPRRMALFTEAIGEVYVRLLSYKGIASVWPTEDGWAGSPEAVNGGLAQKEA